MFVKRKDDYLKRTYNWTKKPTHCLHKQCNLCNGSGIRANGTPCVHMISCRCEKCNPVMMKLR